MSNFHICFILPKILPTRVAVAADNEHVVPNGMSSRARRQTFAERNTIMFMAGAEIFVPFISRPPKAPYQVNTFSPVDQRQESNPHLELSVPLPRCLSNHIKLRTMPPPILPSGQEALPWDLSSEPIVSYQPSHRPRVTPYGYLPDDEQSPSDDGHSSSSTGATAGIQGNFPSTDRIKIRWAAPVNRHQGHGALADGRRRLGVDVVNGLLRSTILGQDDEGRTRLNLEYEGTCSGLWFPGVATQLGMEVVLDARGRSVAWDGEGGWDVTGGTGFTGFDAGSATEPQELSGRPTRDSSIQPSSRPSSYASASLLRTPLPNSSLLPDSSFETTPSPTASMLNSAPSYLASVETSAVILSRSSPLQPIGLHINLGDLPPPPRNEFNFRIQGAILLGSLEDPEDDESMLVLPVFRVVSADSDKTDFVVTSEVAGGVEVILPQDQRYGGSPRRMLRKKSEIRARDGVAIAVESPRTAGSTPVKQPANGTPARGKFDESDSPTVKRRSTVRIEPPVRLSRSPSVSSLATGYPIPWVRAKVTMLPQSEVYSHSVHFTVPSVAASLGILSFGVCLPSFLINERKASIDVVWATAGGRRLSVDVFPRVPLINESNEDLEEFERTLQLIDFQSAVEEEQDKQGGVDDLGLRDLVSWIQIRLPEDVFGDIEANYLIGRDPRPAIFDERRGDRLAETSVLLPCFHVRVGTYTLEMDTPLGLSCSAPAAYILTRDSDYESPLIVSNFHQQTGGRLVHHMLPGYFYPRVKVRLQPTRVISPWSATSVARTAANKTIAFAFFLALIWTILSSRWAMLSLQQDIHEIRRIMATPHASFTPGLGSHDGSWTGAYAWTVPAQERLAYMSEGPVASRSTEFPYATTLEPVPTDSQVYLGSTELELDVIRKVFAMVPAIPLTLLHNLDWKGFTDTLLYGIDKVLGVFKVILNYPLPP